MTPERKHDEALLVLLLAAHRARHTLDGVTNSLLSITKRLGTPNARPAEAIEILKNADVDRLRSVRLFGWHRDDLIERYERAVEAYVTADRAVVAHEKAYTGWPRFFLVTSSDGLIHRNTHCSTCNKGRSATTFALLPSISGTTPETAVEVLGPALCSVCYPEAPVEMVDALRIPARLAKVLFEEGEEAFVAAKAEYERKATERAAGTCEFTGTVTPEVWGKISRNYHKYAKCPTCGTNASVTSTGKFRKHKGGK